MAPIGGPTGGGQAGFGSGGSFTGAQSAFETLGNHVYAMNNGESGAQNVETTIFEGTSGNYYSKGTLRFALDHISGDNLEVALYFNNVQVWGEQSVSGYEAFTNWPLHIIIPAYTAVKMTVTNTASGTGRRVFINYAGRIYR